WGWNRPFSASWTPTARPSLTVHSIAFAFGTGSAPGCARQTGHVRVFGAAPKPTSQRQNIFVRVLSWTWISRPTTDSQSGTSHLLRLAERLLDRAAHLDHRDPLLERDRVHANQPHPAPARRGPQLDAAHAHRPRALPDPGPLPERPPRGPPHP